MIIHLSPDAPLLIRAAAQTALVVHIGGGIVAVAAGGAALVLRKGGRGHRLSGDVFVVAMLVAMILAALTAPFQEPANVPGAIFNIYLVATAWATVRRPPGEVGRLERGLIAIAAASVASVGVLVWLGASHPKPSAGAGALVGALVFCGLVAFAVALDLKMIRRGGISGPPRLARHIWRMCTALFVATGSFFIGQPQVFPAPLRGSPLLLALGLAPLAFMVFWLIRVRSSRRRRAPSLARSPA
jgi:uncharacterized membrane protein